MSALTEDDRRLIEDSIDKFIQDKYAFEEREKRIRKGEKFGNNWAEFAQLGWLALPFNDEVGGLGGGAEESQLMMAHFGRGLIAEPYSEVVLMSGKTLERINSELLLPLISGELRLILAHREEDSIQSFQSFHTTATVNGEKIKLNGRKTAVWQAKAADRFLVSAMIDGEPAIFQIPANHSSLEIQEYPTVDSRFAADLILQDVMVEKDALLSRGDDVADALAFGVLYTMMALIGELDGIARELVVKTTEFLHTREQFGSKLYHFQALQHKLADMMIGAEEIKALSWLACSVIDSEDSAGREKIIRSAKARATVVARKTAESAVQLHGGMGVTDEMVVSHYLRRIVAIDSFYGDSQCQYAWLSAQYTSEGVKP